MNSPPPLSARTGTEGAFGDTTAGDTAGCVAGGVADSTTVTPDDCRAISPGDVVISSAGRDSGRLLAVLSVSGQYVSLADGKLRKVEKPKVKKQKHVKASELNLPHLKDKIMSKTVTNRELRRALAAARVQNETTSQEDAVNG